MALVVVVRVVEMKIVAKWVVEVMVVTEWVVVLSSMHKPGQLPCRTAVVAVQLGTIPNQWIYFSYPLLLPDMPFPLLRSYP